MKKGPFLLLFITLFCFALMFLIFDQPTITGNVTKADEIIQNQIETNIIPKPQQAYDLGGILVVDNTWQIMADAEDFVAAQEIKSEIFQISGGTIDLEIVPVSNDFTNNIIITNPNNNPEITSLMLSENIDIATDLNDTFNQGYVLKVTDDKIIITANSIQGRFYGAMSLLWIISFDAELIVPKYRINDWPDIEVRGVTTGTYFGTDEEQIDYFAKLKYNLWIDKPIGYLKSTSSQATINRAIQLEQYMNERHFLTSLKFEPNLEDQNYQEGHYAEEVIFEFDQNNILVAADNGYKLSNGDFELGSGNLIESWNVIEKSSFSEWSKDCLSSMSGSCSAKHTVSSPLFFTDGDFLQSGLQEIEPKTMYAIRFWAKTEGQTVTIEVRVEFDKGSSNIYPFSKYITIKNPDSNWHLYSSRFWMPDNVNQTQIIIRPYDQRSGSIWIDNLEFIDLREGLLNVIDTPGSKLKITSLDKTVTYEEGMDYTKTDTGTINSRHPFSGKKTIISRIPTGKIPEGSLVLVSYDYIVDAQISSLQYSVDESTTNEPEGERRDRTSYNEPGILELWRTNFLEPTYNNLNPEVHMFWLDEIRGFNRDSRGIGKENYKVLADHINNAYSLQQQYGSNTKVLMWDDMLSPFHNGQIPQYQLIYNGKGGMTRYVSQLISKDIVPIIWWYIQDDRLGALANSMLYYNHLGFRPMVSGYGDVDNVKWLSHLCYTNDCYGYLTVDWNRDGIGFEVGANYSWNSYKPDLSSCNPNHIEMCNLVDDDCDADYYRQALNLQTNRTMTELVTGTEFVDEGYDLQNDEFNCGTCGNICSYDFGIASCNLGTCQFEGCLIGYHNLNGDLSDGCEYSCELTNQGVEIVDGIDNDCDGQIDEETLQPTIDADINDDGFVNIHDLFVISENFGLTSSSIGWDPSVDTCKNDFVINILDMICVINNFS